MPRKRREKIEPVIRGALDLSWRDLQAMGALTVLFSALRERKKRKKEEPKAPPPPTHTPNRYQPENLMKPKEQEFSERDAMEAMKELQEKQREIKRDEKQALVTMDGRFGDPEWKNVEGNKPGILVNPVDPDVLPMVSWRKAKNMQRRKEEEGAVPRYWNRYPIDGKVFGGALIKGRSASRGSVLVDLSGSMSWTEGTIKQLLDHLPEGTVYGYAGGSGQYGEHSYCGRWVILADRGRAVPPNLVQRWRSYAGYNNLVDLPCLKFLSNLPGPRLWISDADVTGRHGFTYQLKDACLKVCRDRNITVIKHADYLPDYLRTGKSNFDTFLKERIGAW